MSKIWSFIYENDRLIREGRVPDDVAKTRLDICASCEKYKGETKGPGTGHCRACGCGGWPISQMHTGSKIFPGRAWYPMGCPMGLFDYHPGRKVKVTVDGTDPR